MYGQKIRTRGVFIVDINNARYELTAVKPSQYPEGNKPEIALVGRSNVGKSTIINTLLNRRNLARVSSAPGKTRGLNFYNIDDSLYFVDLPGYGYAKTSKSQRSEWGGFIDTYLNSRPQLKLIVMLVDIRHAPSGDDKLMYNWIVEHGIPHVIVATKADKISRSQIKPKLKDIMNDLGVKEGTSVIPYSSETKQGKEDIWNILKTIPEEI